MALTERKSLPHILFVMLRWQTNKKMGNDFFFFLHFRGTRTGWSWAQKNSLT